MGFIKKIWKDRISEFPTRRSLTKTDGSSELVTVARSEGMISEEGDAFSAENMNDFENRVANGFSELNEKIGTGIQISNELQTITLPFTAQSNVMMQIKIAHTVDDVVHYCYLKSNFYGNNYYSFVGVARGGTTVEWFPVKKGDTISFQGASGATATYAVFS